MEDQVSLVHCLKRILEFQDDCIISEEMNSSLVKFESLLKIIGKILCSIDNVQFSSRGLVCHCSSLLNIFQKEIIFSIKTEDL